MALRVLRLRVAAKGGNRGPRPGEARSARQPRNRPGRNRKAALKQQEQAERTVVPTAQDLLDAGRAEVTPAAVRQAAAEALFSRALAAHSLELKEAAAGRGVVLVTAGAETREAGGKTGGFGKRIKAVDVETDSTSAAFAVAETEHHVRFVPLDELRAAGPLSREARMEARGVIRVLHHVVVSALAGALVPLAEACETGGFVLVYAVLLDGGPFAAAADTLRAEPDGRLERQEGAAFALSVAASA